MTDAADCRASSVEESPTEEAGSSSAAPASPKAPHSEASSSGASSSGGIFDQESDLLQKIKELVDTQKALKEQKRKCAVEMKNAVKRKKRLQGRASMLSDADLVEVLRMRKAKKDGAATASTPPPEESQPM